MVTVGYRLPTGFQLVTASYRRLLSGHSGLQQVTAGYSSRLPSGYSRLQQVTASYRVVTVGYMRLQPVTEWLQRVTAG